MMSFWIIRLAEPHFGETLDHKSRQADFEKRLLTAVKPLFAIQSVRQAVKSLGDGKRSWTEQCCKQSIFCRTIPPTFNNCKPVWRIRLGQIIVALLCGLGGLRKTHYRSTSKGTCFIYPNQELTRTWDFGIRNLRAKQGVSKNPH